MAGGKGESGGMPDGGGGEGGGGAGGGGEGGATEEAAATGVRAVVRFVNGLRIEAAVADAADELVLIVLLRELHQAGVDDAAAQPQHEVKSRFCRRDGATSARHVEKLAPHACLWLRLAPLPQQHRLRLAQRRTHPSGCCSRRACAHPRAACLRR